jgi:predicted DNA-binding protein YlxM (UPF0122 family)
MTKEELVNEIFLNTDLDTRLNILLESGKDLLTIKQLNRFIKIYLVNDYYVELVYRYDINKITQINLIDTTELIEKYNDFIQIVV